MHAPSDGRYYKTIKTIGRIHAVSLNILVRTTTRSLGKVLDRCTIMDIVRIVITEDVVVCHIIVLDICRLTVDVTLNPPVYTTAWRMRYT